MADIQVKGHYLFSQDFEMDPRDRQPAGRRRGVIDAGFDVSRAARFVRKSQGQAWPKTETGRPGLQ